MATTTRTTTKFSLPSTPSPFFTQKQGVAVKPAVPTVVKVRTVQVPVARAASIPAKPRSQDAPGTPVARAQASPSTSPLRPHPSSPPPSRPSLPSSASSSSKRSLPPEEERTDPARKKAKLTKARSSLTKGSRGATPLSAVQSTSRSPTPVKRQTVPRWKEDEPVPRKWNVPEDGSPSDDYSRVTSKLIIEDMHNRGRAIKSSNHPSYRNVFDDLAPMQLEVTLEYPNTNGSETFSMMEPVDVDHYSPLLELQAALKVFIEYYLSPQQREELGWMELPIGADYPAHLNHIATRNLPRILHRAYRKGRGDHVKRAVAEINTALRRLKEESPNALLDNLRNWTGVPPTVSHQVISEVYQRVVAPSIPLLRNKSDGEVYGELESSFVSRLIRLTHLSPESKFLDVGSGVGNVVLQVALEAGCDAAGIEVRQSAWLLSKHQQVQFEERLRLWGLSAGSVEFLVGDATEHPDLHARMREADVVLINNLKFPPQLNHHLANQFLDLKEGAVVVSLQRFDSGGRLNERNSNDMSSILDVEEFTYDGNSVSWSSTPGKFYLSRVNRQRLVDFEQQSMVRRPSRKPSPTPNFA